MNTVEMSTIYMTQNSSDFVIFHCLISFMLFIIPEDIMSWIVEAASLLCTLARTQNGVIVIIACLREGSFSDVFLKRLSKNEYVYCDQEKDAKYLTVSDQTTSVTKPEVVLVLMALSQPLEGASVMQIRILCMTRWTFHSPFQRCLSWSIGCWLISNTVKRPL